MWCSSSSDNNINSNDSNLVTFNTRCTLVCIKTFGIALSQLERKFNFNGINGFFPLFTEQLLYSWQGQELTLKFK